MRLCCQNVDHLVLVKVLELNLSTKTTVYFVDNLTNTWAKKHSRKLVRVRTDNFKDSVQKVCKTQNDSWANTVQGRIEYAPNLHAADAVYHQVWSTNFRTGLQIPQQFMSEDIPPKRAKRGRPKDSLRRDAFIEVADYIASHDDEQTTVNMHIEKMKEYLPPDVEPYGFTHMKANILDHFGEEVIITEINGKANVVTFDILPKLLSVTSIMNLRLMTQILKS